MERKTHTRILLVEDDHEQAALLSELLEAVQPGEFKLTYADRLSKALKSLEDEEFDLVLTDLGLPDSQGLETFLSIHARIPGTPIVVFTGMADEQTSIRAVREGAQDYLIKGQSNGYLLVKSIRYAIERHKIQKEIAKARGELEMRVQERTAELTNANTALQKEIKERERMEKDRENLLKERDAKTQFLNSVLEQMPTGVIIAEAPAGNLLFRNEKVFWILGHSFGTAKTIEEYSSVLQGFHPDGTTYRLEELPLSRSLRTGEVIEGEEISYSFRDGSRGWVLTNSGPIRNKDKQIIGAVATFLDISEQKRVQEKLRRHIYQLAALGTIDMAITASLDLRVTLDVFLDQATSQLKVDAALVLLLDQHCSQLEYASGRGFRTEAFKHTQLPLGEGCAGRAALERRIIHVPNIRETECSLLRSPLLSKEDFISYYAVPLIAKGNVKGVLELFHRSYFQADQDWYDFLEMLARQAAIAIDNATLFSELQLSNTELCQAYDTTLEGWSRALDLRDKETEGHSQRVTDITLRLARTLGLPKGEMLHIRRGALLHDIGKMGIPDGILLKPGPLTKEEWNIMRMHPIYAHKLLSPINFLRPAIDIPYCHHAKWDGTGYPSDMKGEGIPIAARIFSVVDVWDALSSERPYRSPWAKGNIVQYIKDQSGKHFDPKVVEGFLSLTNN